MFNVQVSSDIPVWIRRRFIRNRLDSLGGESLDEEDALPGVRIRSPELLQVGEIGLKCGDVVFFDARTVDVDV